MKKKIIITGGLGYIGTEICKLYSGVSWHHNIIVIDNRFISERVSQIRNWNMQFIHGDILDKDFDEWSDFDGWENLSAQQWVFARALDIYRGKKIDIKCDCCLFNRYQVNFANIKDQKCFGIKIAFMIANILDEIELAKEKRENNGTYSA